MTINGFIKLRCPVCERARLFRGFFDTPEVCSACGFFFMRETGYFLPYVPIGYAGTVAASLGVWPILRYVFGVQSAAVILTAMIAVAIGFGLWFVRYAKMIWLVVDLTIHPATTEDFEARGRKVSQGRDPAAPTTPSAGDDADA